MTTSVRDADVLRALRSLERAGPGVMADALNRTAFEILDDEERAIRASFKFASGTTARFMARGFAFQKATATRQVVRIAAKPKANELLVDHVKGSTIRAGRERLSFGGKLAVPVPANVKRSARGRVPGRLRPSTVTAPGGKGFVSPRGDVVLQRTGPRKARRVRVLFALIPSAKLEERFDHVEVAERTVRRVFADRARRAIQRAAEKARGR